MSPARNVIFESTDKDDATVKAMVMDDSGLNVREIALELGLPKTSLHRIMTESLGLHKICTGRDPWPLTPEEKGKNSRLWCAIVRNLRRGPRKILPSFGEWG